MNGEVANMYYELLAFLEQYKEKVWPISNRYSQYFRKSRVGPLILGIAVGNVSYLSPQRRKSSIFQVKKVQEDIQEGRRSPVVAYEV